MIPMKNASRDTKRAARPRKLTTSESALATGLRFTTTETPKTSIIRAKIQKSIGDINRACLLLEWVPLLHQSIEDSTQFVELLFVVNHFGTRGPGNGVVFPQEDGLLGTDLFAHAAVDAADHVDLELLRALLDLRPLRFGGDFLRRDGDGAR